MKTSKESNYMLFFKGPCSTPTSIGLKNLTSGEVACEIDTYRTTGKETRKAFTKYANILKRKYPNF